MQLMVPLEYCGVAPGNIILHTVALAIALAIHQLVVSTLSVYVGKLTISGQDSADAKRYQEKDVNLAIQEVEQAQILEEDNELDEDEI